MLDIHTHILPKMDDGSSGSQESTAMIRACVAQGVDRVCLTPHFYPNRESPEEFLKRRAASANRLAEVMTAERQLPKLYLGAELACFKGISRMEGIERFCIGSTRALLVEMPGGEWSSSMISELLAIQEERGLQVVLAHIERYLNLQRIAMVRELCENGVMMQANASAFLEKGSAWIVMRMLKKQRIHLLGSDCHNMRSRKPNLGHAVQKIREKMGDGALNYLKYNEDLILGEH